MKKDSLKVHVPFNRVREIRNLLNMTQKEFADYTQIEQCTISKLERSGKQPSPIVAKKIADAAGVTISEVRGYSTPYTRSDLYLPVDRREYLCAVKTAKGNVVRVLAYDPKRRTWSLPDNGAVIDRKFVDWWAEVPKLPE